MNKLQQELRQATKRQLERRRMALFEQRKKGNRKQDRHYEQLTETIDCLSETTRKRMKR